MKKKRRKARCARCGRRFYLEAVGPNDQRPFVALQSLRLCGGGSCLRDVDGVTCGGTTS